MENVLKQPLNFSQKWTQQAIDDKMQEIKEGKDKYLLFSICKTTKILWI